MTKMFGGFPLLMLALAGLLAAALGRDAAAQVGPSFDCARASVQDQALTRVICATPEIAAVELSYVHAYFTIRHHLGAGAQQVEAVERARLFPSELASRCGLPETGGLPEKLVPTYRACVLNGFAVERGHILARLPREALEELRRSPAELLELQAKLRDRGLLPWQAALDGLYGPQTRAAITSLQHQAALSATGFLDNATAAALRVSPRIAPPPSRAVDTGSCAATGPAARAEQLGRHCVQLSDGPSAACELHARSCSALTAEIVRLCVEGPAAATAGSFVLPRAGAPPALCMGYLR